MLRTYFKIAFRNITRNRTSAFVNVAGLALGMTAFLVLLEYISLEQTVNKFHKNLSQIYRVINQDPAGKTWVETEPGWAAIFKQRFPEIKETCRFNEETGSTIISKNDGTGESFREDHTGYADGNFFSFFSFPLKAGNASALAKPNIVFLSEASVKKYFGNKNPVDQTLIVNNQFGKTIYSVGGVFADMHDNSDIKYNLLFSLATLNNPANLNGNSWAATDNLSTQYINTYFLLNKGVDINAFNTKLTALRTQLKQDKDGVQFRFQAFKDIHLGTSFADTYPTAANLKYIYLLAVIAVLILAIAWFNYINLSTANAFKRANEVGVRKVLGASKANLMLQFLGESFLTNVLSMAIAIVLVLVIQPLFNTLVEKNLNLKTIGSSSLWVYSVVLLLVGSLASGAYAAYSLSNYKPVETLKGKVNKSFKGILLRKSLVVAQFSISVMLIVATVVIYSQVQYMKNKNLGLNPNQLLVIRGPEVGKDSTFRLRQSSFADALANESFVQSFCATGSIPSGHYNFVTSGFTQPSSSKGDELKSYSFAIVDNRFLSTYKIPVVAGRNFTEGECNISWNDNSKVLLNEQATKQLGFASAEDALKNPVQWDERKLQVIGVVKDYNHIGAGQAVDPMIFYPQNNSTYFTVRITPDGIEQKIATLQKLYKSSFNGNPFDYFFVDDNFSKLYSSEKQYGDIFTSAAIWGIFIACLGLFGLVTFTVESRTKEIGVRKVLGASVSNIVSLLSKDFLVLVFIAIVIATPVAWYGLSTWLNHFAYRISISWWIFLLSGIAAAIIAFATISVQTIKVAVANPVKSLRTE